QHGGRAGIPVVDVLAEGGAVHGRGVPVDQSGAVQLAQDGGDAARPMYVLDVVLGGGGRDLAQARHPQRELVDLLQAEVDARLAGGGEQVEDRVGRTAHRHVER